MFTITFRSGGRWRNGIFDDHHGELAALLLDQITVLDAKIAQMGARAAELAAAMPAAWGVDADGTTGPGAGTGPDAPVLNAVARLAEIPGLSPGLARSIIAETGLDMGRFPTAGHLVSWAGLCPSARQSGPRTRAAKKGQGDTWLRGSLGQAAIGAARTTTFLGERYARIARRRGKAKAQVDQDQLVRSRLVREPGAVDEALDGRFEDVVLCTLRPRGRQRGREVGVVAAGRCADE